MNKWIRSTPATLTEAEDEILLKLAELQDALYEKGVKMQFIKVDGQLYIQGQAVTNLNGVDIKTVIHEDDAEVWGAPKGTGEGE